MRGDDGSFEFERFQDLTSGLRVGIYRTCPGQDGTIISCNEVFASMLGYSVAELVGQKAMDFYAHPSDRDVLEIELKRVGVVRNKTVRLIQKSGRHVSIEISVLAVRGDKDRVEFYDGLAMDVSHVVEMYDSISHQLRTPLVAIQTCLNRVLGAELSGEKARLLLVSARASANIGLFLARNLNYMSSMFEHTPESFQKRLEPRPLSPLIHSLVIDLQEYAYQEKQVKIEALSDQLDRLPTVMMDERTLTMALYCVLDNAIKYSFESTKVTIGGMSGGRNVHVIVENKGIPLYGRELQWVFTKQYRTDAARAMVPTGTGLGLYFADHIMKLHGGQVIGEPTKSSVTRFRLVFPLAA